MEKHVYSFNIDVKKTGTVYIASTSPQKAYDFLSNLCLEEACGAIDEDDCQEEFDISLAYEEFENGVIASDFIAYDTEDYEE